jgi:hypothetical protein
MLLVFEINSLRTELKRSRDKVTAFENALGFNQASHAAEAAEMRFKLQHAIEDRDEIDIQHDQILEVYITRKSMYKLIWILYYITIRLKTLLSKPRAKR